MNTGAISRAAEGASICRLCQGPVDPTSGVCSRCGSVASRIGRCAQCQSVASMRPHSELLWICEVCGAARMTQESCEHIAVVRDDLRTATRAHRLALLSKVASYLGVGIGFVGLLFVLFIREATSASLFTSGLLTSLPLLTLLLSAVGFLKTKSLRKTCRLHLEKAYKNGLLGLMSKSAAGATPLQLAETLSIDVAMTEHLLAELNVRDDVASEVTDDGQIAYFSPNRGRPIEMLPSEQPATQRLRVSEDSTGSDTGAATDAEGSQVKTQLSSIAKT